MRLLGTFLTLVVLSACSGGNDTAADTTAPETATSSVTSEPAAATDICAAVAAADISAAAGSTLSAESDPGGGCTYTPEDPRETRVSVTITDIADTSGFATYIAGLDGTLTDTTKLAVPGIGEEATVVVGQAYGSNTATAVARIGNRLIVTMVLAGQPEPHSDIAVATLKVAVDALD